ncbi:MAG TPA: S9 family peptidase [Candidatus Limnocylindria bacterium]|nr:S9 family peptidase [Candidatus Limnocylindria bacterium]
MADVLTLAALRALVSLSDPRLSPDGTRVAYVRTVRDRPHDRMDSALVVQPVAGGSARVVDAGPFVGAPRWSPDGTRLAYLRHDAKHDEDQIVVVRLAGGTRLAVTHAPRGVQHYAWSPDGRRFAYDTPDAEPNAAAAKRDDDLFAVGTDGYLTDKPAAPSHLWLVASDGGAARRLTHGAWSVYEGVPPFAGGPSDPSWSSDGRTIVIARSPDADDAATDRSSVALVDVATGAVRGVDSPHEYVYEPAFAPAGTRFAYLRPHGPGPISAMDVVVATPADGAGDDRTTMLDRDVQSLRWSGNALVATMVDGLRGAIVVIPPHGSPRRVDVGALSVADLDAGPHGELAFVASAPSRPPELYVVRGAGTAPRALTNVNAHLRTLRYAHVETVRWTAPDGLVSEGMLVHPLDERPGVKYPLVIWHHGGPEAAVNLSFDEGTDEGIAIGQLAAARGWYTFLPNYRGSDDLGTKHEHAIFADPGAGPMRDVLAGLATIDRRGTVDTARECIGGHSYGGFMTSWIIGHDSRWRCAVIGDGAVDWLQAYDLSGSGNLAWTRDSLGGGPWTSAAMLERYRADSPIAYATSVRTPTLLLTGTLDETVPFSESWTYFHALHDRGVPSRLIAIPTAHHTPHDPVRLESYERHVLDWFSAYLR